MFYRTLKTSAAYWRDQKVSAMYWRGFRIWQAAAESSPLRKGQIRIEGKAANFKLTAVILPKGNLYLHRNTAGFTGKATLSRGNLHITGHALGNLAISNPMIKGQLHLTRSAFTTKQTRVLASRMLNLTGKATTFTLSSPTPIPSLRNTYSMGDRTALITVTTNGTLGAGAVQKQVDGDRTANSSHAFWFTNLQTGIWMQYALAAPTVFDGLVWQMDAATSQGSWKVQAGNDGVNWVDLSTAFTLGVTVGVGSVFKRFTNTTAYSYYRLLQTAGATSSGPWNMEIDFFAYTPTVDTNRSVLEANTDKTGTYTISTSASIGGGIISNLIDGAWAQNSTDAMFFTSGDTLHEIKIDFTAGKTLVGFAWLQDQIQSHGTWVFEGSNDNSSWTGIGSSFTLGGKSIDIHTFANTTSYRYYRIRNTAGSASSSPWNLEIVFFE